MFCLEWVEYQATQKDVRHRRGYSGTGDVKSVASVTRLYLIQRIFIDIVFGNRTTCQGSIIESIIGEIVRHKL